MAVAQISIRDVLDQNAMVGEPRVGVLRFWTGAEEAVLRSRYPTEGVVGCLPHLPGRSATSIYQRADRLGLRAPAEVKRGVPRQRWSTSPQIDEAIRRIYQGDPRINAVKDLARTLGRPRWWVSKRAERLGYKVPRFKEPVWTEEETGLVAENAHRDPATIARLLKRRGYARSPTAIVVKLKRIGIARGRSADPHHYTATALATAFGMDIKSITRWIEKGWLKAGRRGTARTPQQGGDEHWIHERAVRRFVIDNVAAVDFRKVDKSWLVELLTGAPS